MRGEALLSEELLALWGLQLRRPPGWWVEVPGTSRGDRGELLLRGPRGAAVGVAWGRLGEARRRFPSTAHHMEACLRRLASMVPGERLVVLDRTVGQVGGHPATLAAVEILPRGGWLGRSHGARAALLHCPPRDRFYALYTHPYPAAHGVAEEAFRRLLADFRCH